MANSALQQIQDSLLAYIDGRIALHEFEDVLLPLLWDMDSASNDMAVELAGTVHNLIAECSRGDRTEESLRMELARAIRPLALPQR